MYLHPNLQFATMVDYNIMRDDDIELWRNVSEATIVTLKLPA